MDDPVDFFFDSATAMILLIGVTMFYIFSVIKPGLNISEDALTKIQNIEELNISKDIKNEAN